MYLTLVQIHPVNVRLSENLAELSPVAINFPCPVAVPF